MNHELQKLTALTVSCTLALALTVPASATLSQEDRSAPMVAAFSKNGPATSSITFSPDDFRVTGTESLSSILLTSLPDPCAGMLTIGGQTLPLNSEISYQALSGLRFTPLAAPMLSSTSFTFQPIFSDGTAGEAVTVGLYLLSEENSAPVAKALELKTYKNVELSGEFSGVDPDGDLLTFQLVSKPARGSVTQTEDGSASFIYTPYENKTGRDAFTYVAVDEVGNTSAPASVSIRIEKQKTKVTYADMEHVPGHRDAVRLAEAGLLVGEQMGDQYFFHPDETVSRAQFTALAMSAAGLEVMEEVMATGFSDDDGMDSWVRPYVSSALKSGLIQGSPDHNGQAAFQAAVPITAAEAAVILDRVLDITDVEGMEAFASAPAWAGQSASNLASCGVLPSSPAAHLEEPLDRAQAAQMLSGALDILEQRDQSWFSW